jgi:hypothetical protein
MYGLIALAVWYFFIRSPYTLESIMNSQKTLLPGENIVYVNKLCSGQNAAGCPCPNVQQVTWEQDISGGQCGAGTNTTKLTSTVGLGSGNTVTPAIAGDRGTPAVSAYKPPRNGVRRYMPTQNQSSISLPNTRYEAMGGMGKSMYTGGSSLQMGNGLAPFNKN